MSHPGWSEEEAGRGGRRVLLEALRAIETTAAEALRARGI